MVIKVVTACKIDNHQLKVKVKKIYNQKIQMMQNNPIHL